MIPALAVLLSLSAAPVSVFVDSDPALERAVVERVRAELASAGYRVASAEEAPAARIHLARIPGLLNVLVEVPQASRRSERQVALKSGEALSLSHAATEVVDVLRATLLESRLGAPEESAAPAKYAVVTAQADPEPAAAPPAPARTRPAVADPIPAPPAPDARRFGLQLDGAVTLPVSQPQLQYFGPGEHAGLTGLMALTPYLDLQVGFALAVFPNKELSPFETAVGAYGLGAGARLRRPLEDAQVVPWCSAQLGWTFSGTSSLSLAPSAGVQFRLSPESPLLFGPMVRFDRLMAIGQMPGRENHDASLLSFGLVVEFSAGAAAPKDSDGDGVPDDRDQCPTVAGADGRGCPVEAQAPVDSDGDGIPDDRDQCPTVAGDDGHGCPVQPKVVDSDGDGVLDPDDACPNEKGPAATKGCPDADGDGVPDKEDACPNVAGKSEDRGCPVYKEVVVTTTKLELKQKIYFAFGTTTILPKSHPLLGEVARALQDHEALCVRIEGHTDAVGSADANLKLSQGRTQAVRDYLVAQGLGAKRLAAKGYGSSLPLDNNRTPEGRENNRRVEFVIVPCEGKE